MRSIVMLFLWLVIMTLCCCGAVKAEVENSEKDLIDLEKFGVVYKTYSYDNVYLLKGNTLCGIAREFGNLVNGISYIAKVFYSIKTISTPTTLNITDYTLDEKKSYVEFSSASIKYINTMEGCLFENRKYSVNCYYIQREFRYKLSSNEVPKYFDKDGCYIDDDGYTHSYSYSVDDITYKMDSKLDIYAPNPNEILFYSYLTYKSEHQLWFNTPSSNGYMTQSVDNDEYQFVINENIEYDLDSKESYNALVTKREGYYNRWYAFVKLSKSDDRICFSYNNNWIDFYINECISRMSKSDLIEKFGNIYKQLSASFDNSFDNAMTLQRRILEDKRSSIEKKKELSTQECYYYEKVNNDENTYNYRKYEGYFVNKNTFILIFTPRGQEKQVKVIIPITDPTSISLKEMNCKESEIEIFKNKSTLSFEEYYGNCDTENNQKMKDDFIDFFYRGNYSFSSSDKTITYKQGETISLKTTTCEVFDQTIPQITILFPPIPKNKAIVDIYNYEDYMNNKISHNILYTNEICFSYNENYSKINCDDSITSYTKKKNHMIKGIDDKYFIYHVEYFNLSKYENNFDNPTSTIENVKSSYKSNRESKYQKIVKLINDLHDFIDDSNDSNDEIEYNTEDNYDELYKGNGITDGISALIAKDKMMLFSKYSKNVFVYSYTSSEEGEKTILTLGDMDEEKSYITIEEDEEIACEITPGLYNCKAVKEKCVDEYESILQKKITTHIPSYIENNKLYYQNNNENEGYEIYEISNADIHYKIDHPRIKDYPIKSYEMWSWHKMDLGYSSGYILQTNTSLLQIITDDDDIEMYSMYTLCSYSFNQKDGSILIDAEGDRIRFFHLVENDSRICFEDVESGWFYRGVSYLGRECYKVKKPEEVLKQFKTDYPGLIQKTKKNIEEELNKITNNEVKSIKENEEVNEKKLRKEEEKGYYFEYYYNEYTHNYNGNDDDRYKHYRGYFITSNEFIIIYQYGGDINEESPENIYQIKLIFDFTSSKNFSIYDFNCELSEIELPCSGEEDCPNSKKSFKENFDNCNNKEEMNVYLNDLVDTNIYINIENRRINISDYYEIFLIIPLQEKDLSLLSEEISIITKNTRGVALDKSFNGYLYYEKNMIWGNILKIKDTMISIGSMNSSSEKGMSIAFFNLTNLLSLEYFYTYHEFEFLIATLPNADYCMIYNDVYHNWINLGKYPFIDDFNEVKQMLLSNLETQFNAIYEDVFSSMKDEPAEDKTESPDVTIQPTNELDDEGNIMKISMSLLISMMMIMMILI